VEQACHSGGNEDMIKVRLNSILIRLPRPSPFERGMSAIPTGGVWRRGNLISIIILLIYTILVLWNFDAYSADKSDKEIKINLINFSENDYSKYISPLLPLHGYIFNKNYLHGNNILNSGLGTINFYEGKNTIDNKEFYRLESNAFDKSGNSFVLEWDISKGFFSFNNRKIEAFKFTTEMIFNSEDNDINTVFAKKLIESNNITNVSPLYSTYNETENINGYEFN
jgi:hypothetical protein